MSQVPKYPSAFSARVPKCLLSALSTRVAESLECPSASVSQLVSKTVSQLVYNAGSVR